MFQKTSLLKLCRQVPGWFLKFGFLMMVFHNCVAMDLVEENKIKAAYLFQLINYVSWPETSKLSNHQSIDICVFGNQKIETHLRAVQGRQVKGKRVNIHSNPKKLKICEILYLESRKQSKTKKVLNNIAKYAVLTVGSAPDFIKKGGAVGFVTHNQRVRFRINLDRAEGAGLKISARLLEVALQVVRK